MNHDALLEKYKDVNKKKEKEISPIFEYARKKRKNINANFEEDVLIHDLKVKKKPKPKKTIKKIRKSSKTSKVSTSIKAEENRQYQREYYSKNRTEVLRKKKEYLQKTGKKYILTTSQNDLKKKKQRAKYHSKRDIDTFGVKSISTLESFNNINCKNRTIKDTNLYCNKLQTIISTTNCLLCMESEPISVSLNRPILVRDIIFCSVEKNKFLAYGRNGSINELKTIKMHKINFKEITLTHLIQYYKLSKHQLDKNTRQNLLDLYIYTINGNMELPKIKDWEY